MQYVKMFTLGIMVLVMGLWTTIFTGFLNQPSNTFVFIGTIGLIGEVVVTIYVIKNFLLK
jgi:hypothetical protein